ncbi:MAG: quinone-dependent dihydroorotate dehydrogenase [Candidatus Sumerlaeaceae bacterium]
MVYERLLRPVLFRMWNSDAESAHHATMRWLVRAGERPLLRKMIEQVFTIEAPSLHRQLFGLTFRNPVGLAGGFDKNALSLPGLEALGFGFLEVGTVTRHPQPGNARPRLFRLPQDEAIINRLGFNNDGADALAARLAQSPRNPVVPIGISIGKSKATPPGQAIEDYVYSFRALFAHGDYFAINVSSPNTPGLRQLQDKDALDALLVALGAERSRLGQKPFLVKIAPDLEPAALDELLQVCAERSVDGLIATNTTLSREGLHVAISEEGGLSGRPLFTRALGVVRHVRSALPRMPIIGVGGIMSGSDALQMMDAGADLVQIYTGLIYRGPGLVKEICRTVLA